MKPPTGSHSQPSPGDVAGQPHDLAVLLPQLLGETPVVLDFAGAVVRHLTGATGPAERDRWLAEVVEVLRWAHEGELDEAASRLAARPDLLSSFFQNADLLPPAAAETAAIAGAVMRAMERVEGMLE
jgi:hypothetical protein